MKLIKSTNEDFERITSFYRFVIDNTPDMTRYCRWIYGKHPSDEMITSYIKEEAMYYVEEEGELLAAVAVTESQGEDYHPIEWEVDLRDDEVAVVHILCVNPLKQKSGIAKQVMGEIIKLAKEKGKKAVRLDALIGNDPAHGLYRSLGFKERGVQNWYAFNLGYADFALYEYVISRYEAFLDERVEIGEGMIAKVYSWEGYAYKCFNEAYPKEWLEFELNQQKEVCKSSLPIPKYYESEFKNSIKMDLIQGVSMAERLTDCGKKQIMDDFMYWFEKIHEVSNLKLHSLDKEIPSQIESSPVDDEIKVRARECFEYVNCVVLEQNVLCHMDYHLLNVMYEGNNIRLIDWVNARDGKPIWDFARTYVIFYQYVAGMKRDYEKRVIALRGYSEEVFKKAVYVEAVCRLNEQNTKRVKQLISICE